MEERLRCLINMNSEQSRTEVAKEWKRQGKGIVGVCDTDIPEEIIFAAGMLPWRITGTWRGDVPLANIYRPVNTDVYCTHVLQSVLAGELDFLDGIVFSREDDDMRRLYDICLHLERFHINKMPFTYILHLPKKYSEATCKAFQEGIIRFKGALEQFSGEISEQSLHQAIEVYNKWRTLLMRIYNLRKKEVPPISGSEALGIVTASFVMSKDEFSQELEALFPYIEKRETSLARTYPRLLVSSDKLDNPAYLELIENLGAIVAMDDLDTGSRYFWKLTDSESGPISALAERYLTRPSLHNIDHEKYANQLIGWVREYNITGVLNLPHMFGYLRQMATPYITKKLTEAGIPIMSFIREYHLANTGQLQTRIGAFLETLK